MTHIVARIPAALVAGAVGLLALLALYTVAFDQGLLATRLTDVAAASGGLFHEAFHDARHLLGVPCH